MQQRPRLEKQRLEVPRHLLALWPKIATYAIAFATVALLWLCHYAFVGMWEGRMFETCAPPSA
jgi:uncharacterized membrane protein